MRNMDLLVKKLKNKIILIIIIGTFLFLNIGDVSAFSNNLATIKQHGVPCKKNGRLYGCSYGSQGVWYAALKKDLAGTIVFCTKFNVDPPSKGNRTCTLTNNWDAGTRAGIAYLIGDNYINNGLSKANSAYIDVELAISRFLSQIGDGGDGSINKAYNIDWVNTAVTIRNNVNYAINNISVSIGSVSTSQDENNYYLSIPITYSNANGSYVSVSKGGTTYSKIGNNYVIPKNTLSEGNNTINISATATYSDWQARQYNCGGDRQPVTPNYREWTQLANRTATKSINLVKESKGNIQIKIFDNTTKKQIINPNRQAKFQVYSGTDCSGNKEGDVMTTSSGVTTASNLKPGIYSVEEIEHPSGYVESSNKCVAESVNVTSGKTELVDVYYKRDCEVELENSDRSVQSLIDLYTKFNLKGLLNFKEPSCSNPTCNKNDLNDNLSCLEGNNNLNTDFNENNLSCYDEKIDENGSLGFCLNTFNLVNKLNTSTFYNKSGQFLIKRESDEEGNYYQLYNNNLEPIKIPGNYIASSTTNRICYIYNKENYDAYDNVENSSIFFGDNDGDTKADELKFESSRNLKDPIDVNEYFRKYEYEETKNYLLNPVYLKRLTGKYSSEVATDTMQIPVYGILSNFNTTNGIIPFTLKYGNDEYSPDSCVYQTKEEIITYDEVKNGELKLEFRQINTSNPFPGKSGNTRKIGSNWCETDSNGNVISCSSNSDDNNLINDVIINRNNSYNKNKEDKPLYKIELTPSLINRIRGYNKEHSYDEYNVECDEKGKCTNSFLKEYIFGK